MAIDLLHRGLTDIHHGQPIQVVGLDLSAALLARENGAKVLLATKLRFGDANTMMAQGGIQAADKEGWIVSVTPSGGWVPAFIAGETGIGLSQRMQSFVLDPAENPYNVVQPGQRPRVTLTPSMAFRDGKPFLSFSVQGGDAQDQNLLQFFLNVVEFGMNVQQAVEAHNITSYQMQSSFGAHKAEPGRLQVASIEVTGLRGDDQAELASASRRATTVGTRSIARAIAASPWCDGS